MLLAKWIGILGFITLSACTPGYVNTADLGAVSTPAAVTAHYAGKSIKFTDPEGTVEAYYGADGSWKAVADKGSFFGTGTWRVRSFAGGNQIIIVANGMEKVGGRWKSSGSLNFSGIVYIQPDGTAVVDALGGGNRTQPIPTSGFRYQSRYNRLKQSAGG